MRRTIIIVAVCFLLLPACSNAKEKNPTVQKAVVAGVFYPADPAMLKRQISGYLSAAKKKDLSGHLMGIVAPHAGYRYSGPTAAYAFKELEGKKYKRVVVIAPSHRMPLAGAALSTRDVYETPLGNIPIDTEMVKRLIAKYAWASDDQRPYGVEHALEVELPFLQSVLKDFKLIPIIVGTHDQKTLDAIAWALDREMPGDDVLIVASTDLSHYKPYDEAVKLDRRTLSVVEKGKPSAFWNAVEKGEALACGAAPTYVLMKMLQSRGGGYVTLLQYLNSGDTAGDRSKVVGYAAIAFTTNTKNFTLTVQQKQKLLALAKRTVDAHVRGKKLPSIATDDPVLEGKGASFVTLKKNGRLRGCIGHITAAEPLIENVRNMAVSASSSDPRFPPVRPDELKDIHVEVSVLTPPQLLDNPLDVKVGTDGLIIQKGFNRGVLLPQVPTEQGWNKDEYLRGICRKAGMEPACWKTAKLEKFQAIVFGE